MQQIRVILLTLTVGFICLPAQADQRQSLHGNVRTTQARIARPNAQRTEANAGSLLEAGLDTGTFTIPAAATVDMGFDLGAQSTSMPARAAALRASIEEHSTTAVFPSSADYDAIEKEYSEAVAAAPSGSANCPALAPGKNAGTMPAFIAPMMINQTTGNVVLIGATMERMITGGG